MSGGSLAMDYTVADSQPIGQASSVSYILHSGFVAVMANSVATSNPSKLTFTTQPVGAVSVGTFSTQPVIVIQDALRNTVASSAATTLSITSGTGTTGATLSGTTTVNAVNGVATFTDLNVDKSGSGYTLTATSDGLTSVLSSPFNVMKILVAPGISRYVLWGLFGFFVILFILLLLKSQLSKLIVSWPRN